MDGQTGTFTILPSDKKGIDNRVKDELKYVGESYLKFAESQKYFIKLGVDAPENLLALHRYRCIYKCFGFSKSMGTTC